MDIKNFPPAWDKRLSLDLDDLELPDVDRYKSFDRMSISRGNTSFLKQRKRTRSRLAKMGPIVRWVFFQKPCKDFAKDVGLSTHGYVSTEKDMEGRMPQFHTYHRVIKYWGELGITRGVRDQALDLLTMPDLFEQKNPKRGERYDPQPTLLAKIDEVRSSMSGILNHTHLNAFYHRIGFDVGHTAVNEKFPGFWNKLFQRAEIGTVPPATESLGIIETMYSEGDKESMQLRTLRLAEGKALWSEAKLHQYRTRTVEEPLAEFLTRAELDLAEHWQWNVTQDGEKTIEPMTLTAAALRDAYGIDNAKTQALVQSELVEWTEIKSAASRMLNPQELRRFERDWSDACALEKKRASFGSKAEEAMIERGFTFKSLYDALMPPTEVSAKKSEADDEETRNRPENVIRGIFNKNSQSSSIAIESLLRLLSRDGKHYLELRESYASERVRYFRRNGFRLQGQGLEMRIQRELVNMSMSALAEHFLSQSERKDRKIVREKDIELQKLERGEVSKHPIPFWKVFGILERAIEAKKIEAEKTFRSLNDFPEALKQWTTVSELATNCIKGMKGANYVADAMENFASSTSAQCLRPDVILQASRGEFVPPLPPLRIIAKSSANVPLPPSVVLDWYQRFPGQLQKGCAVFSPASFTSPLARCLCTLIGSESANLIDFFERVDGIRATQGTDFIRRIDSGECDPHDWWMMRKILKASGFTSAGFKWQFAEILFRNGQNVDVALAEILPRMKQAGFEIHSENLPGLTPEELEKYRKR